MFWLPFPNNFYGMDMRDSYKGFRKPFICRARLVMLFLLLSQHKSWPYTCAARSRFEFISKFAPAPFGVSVKRGLFCVNARSSILAQLDPTLS